MAPNMGKVAPVKAKTNSLIGPGAQPRGMGRSLFPSGECICERPHCRIICCVCGYLGSGRVKHSCPVHPNTIFLIDLGQCPLCRAYAMHMTEF